MLEMLKANNEWDKSIYGSATKLKDIFPGKIDKLQKTDNYQYYFNREWNQLYRQKIREEEYHLLEVVKDGNWEISLWNSWENAVRITGVNRFKSHGQVKTFEYFTDKNTNLLYRVSLIPRKKEIEL